jgi:hypothetical protein
MDAEGRIMDKIITMLKERNKYLAKFSAINIAELGKMTSGSYDSIDEFYNAREGILGVIKQIELMLEKRLNSMGDFTNASASIKKYVSHLLKERDELVNQILNQDLEILSLIDQTKNTIIQELQSLRKNRKVIGSYKSGNKTNTLDEEI